MAPTETPTGSEVEQHQELVAGWVTTWKFKRQIHVNTPTYKIGLLHTPLGMRSNEKRVFEIQWKRTLSNGRHGNVIRFFMTISSEKWSHKRIGKNPFKFNIKHIHRVLIMW